MHWLLRLLNPRSLYPRFPLLLLQLYTLAVFLLREIYQSLPELYAPFFVGIFPAVKLHLQRDMTTIHFSNDAIRPVRTNGSIGGVYSTRSGSHHSIEVEKSGRTQVTEGVDEEVALKKEGDIKKKQASFGRCEPMRNRANIASAGLQRFVSILVTTFLTPPLVSTLLIYAGLPIRLLE